LKREKDRMIEGIMKEKKMKEMIKLLMKGRMLTIRITRVFLDNRRIFQDTVRQVISLRNSRIS